MIEPKSRLMAYGTKPLPFDPKSISGISEKVLVSHYETKGSTALSSQVPAACTYLRG